MSSIRSKNTRPEIAFGKILWKNGLRYRKHYPIPGKPDFVAVSARIAIFVDGDFWHGHNWKLRGIKSQEHELATYNKFWRNKILRNIKRDKRVNKELRENKWKVFRCWESDIKKNPEKAAKKILNYYECVKRS